MQNITPCRWFDTEAEEAAAFYTSIFLSEFADPGYVNVVGRRYGEGVAAVADRDEPRWADWLSQRLPAIDPMTVPR